MIADVEVHMRAVGSENDPFAGVSEGFAFGVFFDLFEFVEVFDLIPPRP